MAVVRVAFLVFVGSSSPPDAELLLLPSVEVTAGAPSVAVVCSAVVDVGCSSCLRANPPALSFNSPGQAADMVVKRRTKAKRELRRPLALIVRTKFEC